MAAVAPFLVLRLVVHTAAVGRYGYHGDELYFLACADHLDWGYVDHPPLSVWILAGVRALLGDSLVAIRLVPILCGLTTLWIGSEIARAMGGGPFARAFSAAALLVCGVHLAITGFFTVTALDLLWWAWAQLMVALLLVRQTRPRWAGLAVALGFGLLTKWTMLWFALGLGVGILATEARRWLRGPAPWLVAAAAALLASPYLVWQGVHGWPTLDWLASGANVALRDAPLVTFLGNQILAAHPLNFPIWIAGLASLLCAPFLRDFRLLGIQAAVVLAVLAWSAPGVVHYPAPVYTVLLPAGAVAFERITRARWPRRLARPAGLGILLIGGSLGVPLALPVLPEEEVAPYAAAIGFQAPEPYGREHHAFPQQFSTMLGWEEIVAATARVWKGLPADERDGAAILGISYGEAGAIDRFGARHGLPRAVSAHQSYWLWGPQGYDLETGVVAGAQKELLERWWRDVKVAETVACPRCEPWRQEIPIAVVRRPRARMPALWHDLRHY